MSRKKKSLKETKSNPTKKTANPQTPEVLPPITVDSTSHIEISRMRNIEYAGEIIKDADNVYNPDRLTDLKKSNSKRFLNEAEKQIKKMCHAIEALTAHTGMFVVHYLIKIGDILHEVESSFENKSDFMEWKYQQFQDRHIRYFQQARQIASMGAFASMYASLGKNRLLEFDRLKKVENVETVNELIQRYPFPDTTEDMEGDLHKEHIDAIVTLSRFKNEGIDFVEHDQAALLSCYNGHALEIKIVKRIKQWLNTFSGPAKKREMFDIYVMDKMSPPSDTSLRETTSQISLNKILSDLIVYCEGINFRNKNVFAEQRNRIDDEIFNRAYSHMERLSAAMNINEKKTKK